jgi:DnaK suppressor protein
MVTAAPQAFDEVRTRGSDMDETRARELLLAERAEVESLLKDADAASVTDLERDSPVDYGDEGEELSAEAQDESVAEDLRNRLAVIDRALARLDAGTYGRSARSGKPIPDERLEADPAAELTVEEARG